MDMQAIILGTGAAMATRCYNTCFALQHEDSYFLVDGGGGNGIMSQLAKAGIPYQGIHHMFVTHGHTDHVLGAVWMMRKMSMLMLDGKYEGDFTVYCHDGLVSMLNTFCSMMLPKDLLAFVGTRILLHEVNDGEHLVIAGLPMTFFNIGSTKAKQFGFATTLPDGQSLVCLGDEPYKESSKQYVQHCDWLFSEAYCLYEDRDIFNPYKKHHSTVLDSAQMAESLSVKNLILYHTEDTGLATRKERYSREAKTIFQGTVFVPDDLETIVLKKA